MSFSFKDFDNLFSVYTDAVFSPLLREETFMQEGIRISSEGGMHFEGVVFSEMLGEMAEHEYVLASASTKPLFGNSPYQYESGGDARCIASLTYKEYLEAYNKVYSPANLSLFLYGDMDITPLLDMLDTEYLSVRDKGVRIARVGITPRWSEPRRFETASAAEDGAEDSSVMVSWLLGDNAEAGESTLLSLIVDILLGSPGCPLYKAIAESDLGKDLSSESGMCSSYRELAFSAGFSGARPEDAEKIEDFILSSSSLPSQTNQIYKQTVQAKRFAIYIFCSFCNAIWGPVFCTNLMRDFIHGIIFFKKLLVFWSDYLIE